jgi:gamma-glutamylcyclotransferase (GGCT)/AIG2-like uncharacterized protein YtfP
LRPGGWNHEQWLAPFLAAPPRPARLSGMALHCHDRLPAIVPAVGAAVVGEVATLRAEDHDDALSTLDDLEGTALDLYQRLRVRVDDGEEVWAWVAGPIVAAALGPATLVPGGDWLAR